MIKQVFLLLLTSLMFTIPAANGQTSQIKKHQTELCPSTNVQSRKFKKPQPKFGAGVKAGINYSSQYIKNTVNIVDFICFRSKYSYHGGTVY